MRWIRRWTRCHQALVTRRPRRRPLPAEPQEQETDVPPRGCAWFDSSHDLMRGLVVREIESLIVLTPVRA